MDETNRCLLHQAAAAASSKESEMRFLRRITHPKKDSFHYSAVCWLTSNQNPRPIWPLYWIGVAVVLFFLGFIGLGFLFFGKGSLCEGEEPIYIGFPLWKVFLACVSLWTVAGSIVNRNPATEFHTRWRLLHAHSQSPELRTDS
jgi:hypothetical protein